MTEAGDINYTFQYPRIVQYRQEVVVASRNLAHQLAHRQIWTDGVVILLNHALHAHQRKRRTVYVVSEQLALPSQSQGVDAMALEDADGEQGRDAHDHQRHEELIAAREFGDEEDARQRSMHHARNQTSHTHQRKVLLRHMNAYLIDIPQAGKEEARKSADKERRGKGSTATATTIGCRSGKYLGKGDQRYIEDEQIVLTREQRTVHHLPPLCLVAALEQDIHCRIALAIERWEEEDERAEDESTKQQFGVWILAQLAEESLAD